MRAVVPGARPLAVQGLVHQGQDLPVPDPALARKEAVEKDPADVGLDEHHRLVEGEGGQGPGGGLADAGKGAEGVNRVGEASVKLRHHPPGDAHKGQGAAVVPQSLPGGHDVPQGGPGQGPNVGEGMDKGLILEGHAFHLGLLQHDFGNEDVIGVSGGPPGQLPPLVMKKPVEVPAKSAGRRRE